MPDAAAEPLVPADEATDPLVLLTERRLSEMRRLAEMGMELAEMGMARARQALTAEADPAKGKDPADFFGPLTRSIRLTWAAEAKTIAELRDLRAGIVRETKEERKRTAKRHKKAASREAEERRARVSDLVLEAAEREITDVEAFIDLEDALHQRLDDDPAYADFLERPVGETVERLCGDLKLNPDWRLWDGEGWIRKHPPARPLWSPFHQPSAKHIPRDDPPAPQPQPQPGRPQLE